MSLARRLSIFPAVDTMEAAEVGNPETDALMPRTGWARTLLGRVNAWDLALIRYLADHSLPRAINLPLILLVRIGDGWIWAAVALSLYWALPAAELQTVVARCLVALAFSLALYWPVKLLVRRTRPHKIGLGITAQVPPLDKYSFPSGHTMNNLAVALALASHFQGLIAAAIGFPLLLGALRVKFGVHFLTDILGGGVLGASAFAFAQAVFPLMGL